MAEFFGFVNLTLSILALFQQSSTNAKVPLPAIVTNRTQEPLEVTHLRESVGTSGSTITLPCTELSPTVDPHRINRTSPMFLMVQNLPADYEQVLQRAFREKYPENASMKKHCLSPDTLTHDCPMSRRSTCPFHWEEDYKEERIPRMMMKAKCDCPEKPRIKPEFMYGAYTNCTELFVPMSVFYREKCFSADYRYIHQYRLVWEYVPIACVQTLYYDRPSVQDDNSDIVPVTRSQ